MRGSELAQRLGSGDGERKMLLTRQIAFEPLPASVLFGLVCRLSIATGSLGGCSVVAGCDDSRSRS